MNFITWLKNQIAGSKKYNYQDIMCAYFENGEELRLFIISGKYVIDIQTGEQVDIQANSTSLTDKEIKLAVSNLYMLNHDLIKTAPITTLLQKHLRGNTFPCELFGVSSYIEFKYGISLSNKEENNKKQKELKLSYFDLSENNILEKIKISMQLEYSLKNFEKNIN